MKLSKKHKYIIYKLSDDYKEIVVEEASADKDWENFREKLVNATSKSRSVSLLDQVPNLVMFLLLISARVLLAKAPATLSTTLNTASLPAMVSGTTKLEVISPNTC